MTLHIDGLHPAIQAALHNLLNDPLAVTRGVYVVSAYRSPEEQKVLYDAAVAKYGAANASKWVAPPWHSNHGPTLRDDGTKVPYGPNQGGKWGGAIDFGVHGVVADSQGQWPAAALAWFDPLAAKYGFRQVMAWEDWHRETVPGFNFTTTPTQGTDMTSDEHAFLSDLHAFMATQTAYFKDIQAGLSEAKAKIAELETKIASPVAGKLHVDGDLTVG